MPKKRVTHDSPILPVEYPATDGEAIAPCHDCLPWHAEVVLDHPRGGVWVREWHAVDCPVLAAHDDEDE